MSAKTFDEIETALRGFVQPSTDALRAVVGIDGGIDGAVAWNIISGGNVTRYSAVLDLPTVADPGSARSGRQAIDMIETFRWLLTTAELLPTSFVVERFTPIPAASAAAMRSATPDEAARRLAAMEASNMRLAGTVGKLDGLVAAAAVTTDARVLGSPTAVQWRKALGLPGDAPKDSYRAAAQRLFVTLADRLRGVTHHNRAEALLISEYGKGAKA